MLQDLHVPTMFLTIIFACVSLALSIGWVTWRNNDDGLRSWAAALCLQAVGYSLLSGEELLPVETGSLIASTMIALSYSCFLRALTVFRDRPVEPALLWGPPAILAVILLALPGAGATRVGIASAVYLLQSGIIGAYLIRHRRCFPARGRNLILFTLAMIVAMRVSRTAISLLSPEHVSEGLTPSTMQSVTYLTVFAALILISNGFVMMSKERSDERLKTVALKDRLTGCWNRIRIEEAGRQEMARLKRYGHPATLIIVDLDHFKAINDRFGHGAGDEVLKAFADIARTMVRTTDIVGRWGGEEFIVILPLTGFPEAVATAERIRVGLESHTFAFASGCKITASFGVATCLSTDNWADWLERADRALYRAKTAGRNRVDAEGLAVEEGFSPGPDARILQLFWRPAYESGHALLDEQHRALFEDANQLLRLSTEIDGKDRILACCAVLACHVKSHFADEECIIGRQGYLHQTEHRDMHTHLVERFAMMISLFEENRIGTPELAHFVAHEVVAQHMLIEDRKFFAVFQPRLEPASH